MGNRYSWLNKLILLLIPAGLCHPASALTFQGIADYSLALRTGGGDIQKSELIVTPRWDFNLSESTRSTLILRSRADAVDTLAPGQPTQPSRSHWNRRAYLGSHADLELRELYIDATLEDTYIRLGKQQVVWGQADGLRVLDVLNPIDYREFILPDVDDRRIPLWMLNLETPLGVGMLQWVLIADQTYDQLPASDAAFAFSSPLLVPSAPSNVPVTLVDYDRPKKPLQDADTGVRWKGFVGGWDLSLNYLYHYQDQAVFYLSQSQNSVRVSPTYERSHLVGVTASNAFGDFAFRGELGYSTDRYWVADPSQDDNGVDASPELAYVIGIDYSGLTDTFLSFQLFQSHLTEPASSVVRDQTTTQITALARHNLLNEALALEAFVIHGLNQDDGLVQLKARYQISSALSGRVGADLFYGDSDGLFGQFRPANRVHAGLSYAF
ncbi:MAG: hypothetical protein CVV07_09900 [Gammaproteobacteria bacterium HGW-Gammaproteobacteria-11]|nr:MAG: hypothetical protein CVV07_09900 [Gammaproteobacteria bacterium HGW-Gammaproteobacteria-11]